MSHARPAKKTLIAMTIGLTLLTGTVYAQKKPTRAIDVKAERLQKDFLRNAASIAKEYEDAGDLEKAKEVLRSIVRLDGSLEGVKAKIKEIDEELLSKNEYDLEIDPSRGWIRTKAQVSKDLPVRIQTTGSYKLIANMTVTSAGVKSEDPATDLVSGVPLGAVMGIVIKASASKGGKVRIDRSKPFTIGAEYEFKPDQDGVLFLRVNVPPETKCTGTIRAKISGNIRPAK